MFITVQGLAATTTVSDRPVNGELFLLTSPFIDPVNAHRDFVASLSTRFARLPPAIESLI